jgi:hypothetical protein
MIQGEAVESYARSSAVSPFSLLCLYIWRFPLDTTPTINGQTHMPALPEALRLLTYAEAAERLGRCQKTVENLCRKGLLRRVYVGPKSPRITWGDLITFLTNGGVIPTPSSKSGTVSPTTTQEAA